MRVYKVGDKVRLADGSIGEVTGVFPGAYQLPEGQNLGGGTSGLGGEYQYAVKVKGGKNVRLQDREVYNIPKEKAKVLRAAPRKKRKS